jgi:DNA-directed RNA polymerase specialized sigma24 family protein
MRIAGEASDGDLLLVAGSDRAAFEELYRRYVRRVSAFAATRCSCAEDVADVVAQTFVRLLGAAERYDPGRAEVAPFVLGIAANVVRDLHRLRGRQRALVSRLAGADLLDADDTARIEAAIDAARSAGRVVAFLVLAPAGPVAVPGSDPAPAGASVLARVRAAADAAAGTSIVHTRKGDWETWVDDVTSARRTVHHGPGARC